MPAASPSLIHPEPSVPILIYPDPRLQLVCEPVNFDTQGKFGVCDIGMLFDSMWETLEYYQGYGLAAPQLGAPVRAIIVHINQHRGSGCKIEIVNPKLTISRRHGRFMSDEGCLSWPGHRANIRRWQKVKIEGFDRHGSPVTFGGRGQQAAALQHEVEHLDGINIADRGRA